ncbi:MAG TPA: protein kinase [Thermoleophilaceae bacterium]
MRPPRPRGLEPSSPGNPPTRDSSTSSAAGATRAERRSGERHDQGLVHGDVPLGNVVIRESDGTAKLADFGLAQGLDACLTGPEDAAGTPAYMAPELLDGGAPSPRSDLYSLAAVAQVLLTGRSRAATDEEMTMPNLPPALADALRRGLSPDPAKRQPSVAEFMAAA